MKKLILLILALILLTTSAFAAEVKFSYPVANEPKIDGFILFENVNDQAIEVFRITDKTLRTFTVDLGPFTQCRTFFMAAYKEELIAPYGPGYTKCPDYEVPAARFIPLDQVQGLIIR